jgi:hypothetical protein
LAIQIRRFGVLPYILSINLFRTLFRLKLIFAEMIMAPSQLKPRLLQPLFTLFDCRCVPTHEWVSAAMMKIIVFETNLSACANIPSGLEQSANHKNDHIWEHSPRFNVVRRTTFYRS